nr:MAG TPA: hypothetical protein [Caudoviricetes sp.]
MERLTRPDVDVTEYADNFLNTRLKGKEIDWKRTNDAGIDLLINAITCDEFSKDVFRQMARDLYGRLKQFEDAVQTPENFYKMYGEFCLLESALKNYGSHDRMKELSEADKEGRVVVLPCKVGDTVFARLDNKSKYVCECKVKQIVVGNIGFVTFAPIDASEREYDVSLRGFGKTVFLSREEAERAMEGQKND